MKVVVTGGTGFLGRHVLDALLASGHTVRALVRDPRVNLPAGVEAVRAALWPELPEPAALAELLHGHDAVLHLAGQVSRDPRDATAMHGLHVQGTQRLLAAMKLAQVSRLVLASTSGTIACTRREGAVATEASEATLEVIGEWPYYVSKGLQEKVVLAAHARGDVSAIILNPSLLLGPGDDRLSSVGDVHRILQGEFAALTPGTMAFVDVRDAAPAFIAALTQGRAGERYLLSGANLSVRRFAERVASAGQVSAPWLQVSERWALRGARLLEGVAYALGRESPIDAVSVEMGSVNWACSADKARRDLAFAPRDPQETIMATVKDLQRRGLAPRPARAVG